MADIDFECGTCKVMFSWPLFDISRASEIMIDTPGERYAFEVDIQRAAGIACFCSSSCREKGRIAAMAAEGVPVPSERPVYAPVEPCAICNAPVDLHEWHLTYSEMTLDINGRSKDFDYLAIVCPTCESELERNR